MDAIKDRTGTAAMKTTKASAQQPAVWSWNEWDPLEEVIVGNVDGAVFPPWHITLAATMPRESWSVFQTKGGRPFPSGLIDGAFRG